LRKKFFIFLVLTLLGVSTLALPVQAQTASGFSDTSKSWAQPYITQLYNQGLIKGYADGTFKPDNPMSRAEFTTLLVLSMGITPTDSSSNNFSDTGTHWAKAYINAAVAKGILIPSEYPQGLKPDGSIYRSEACTMLVRVLGQSPSSGTTTFKDQDSINQSMYKGYIKTAAALGLISGYPDGTFRPFDPMQRGEVCRVATLFLTKLGTPPASSSTSTSGRKVSSVTYDGYTYSSDWIKLYINSANSQNYLSAMQIIDQNNVKIGDQSYNLSNDKISIQLGDSFFDITAVVMTDSDTSLQLQATAKLFTKGITMSDISAIFVNNTSLDLSSISTPSFIIDGSLYGANIITIDAKGIFSVNGSNDSYSPDKVTMVISGKYYQINSIAESNNQFNFYCTTSSETNWVMVNNKYVDQSTVQIVQNGIVYDMSQVLVAGYNIIRVGGKQQTLDGSYLLQQNGQLYTIISANYDSTSQTTEFITGTYTGSSGSSVSNQPSQCVFYLQNTEYYNGSTAQVSIEVNSQWVNFAQIIITDPAHYSYNGTVYSLIGAMLQINQTQFQVTDTTWHGSNQELDLYMNQR
jgi:hypothetical protein